MKDCKLISYNKKTDTWDLYDKTLDKFPQPRWEGIDSKILINTRDTTNYGVKYPKIPSRSYKEFPGVIPNLTYNRPAIATFSNNKRDLEYAKLACDTLNATPYKTCKVITQDDKGNYSLWSDMGIGDKLDPTHKSWAVPGATVYKTGKYFRAPTPAEFLQLKEEGNITWNYLE